MKELDIGQKIKYTPDIEGGTFYSDNPSVVTVTEDGIVEGISVGSGNIIYSYTDVWNCDGLAYLEIVVTCKPEDVNFTYNKI
ncbi:MAG: Ig-like domain-containing protein [Novosphingobium sp.]|nr:Ig-like domain-containing protein [Novosphingobium sp.]